MEPFGLRHQIMSFKRALTAEDVATLLSVVPDTIYKQARKGLIPNFRIGSAVRFDPKALVEWMEKQ